MTFKRSIAIALALLLLLGALPEMLPAAQASPPDDQCPSPYSGDGHHKWVQFSKEDATCTQDGKIHYVCSYCERDYFETLPALGHSMGPWQTVRAATCTQAGLEERTCVRCGGGKNGYREERAIPAGHQYGAWETDTAGTCVTKERQVRRCKLCGQLDYWTKDYGDHDWGDGVITKQPTATEDGIKTYTCKNDPSHTKTEVIPATGEETKPEKQPHPGMTVTLTADPDAGEGKRIEGAWVTCYIKMTNTGDCPIYTQCFDFYSEHDGTRKYNSSCPNGNTIISEHRFPVALLYPGESCTQTIDKIVEKKHVESGIFPSGWSYPFYYFDANTPITWGGYVNSNELNIPLIYPGDEKHPALHAERTWADDAGEGKRYEGAEVWVHAKETNVGDCDLYAPKQPYTVYTSYPTPPAVYEPLTLQYFKLEPGQSLEFDFARVVHIEDVEKGVMEWESGNYAGYFNSDNEFKGGVASNMVPISIPLTYPDGEEPEEAKPGLEIKWEYDMFYSNGGYDGFHDSAETEPGILPPEETAYADVSIYNTGNERIKAKCFFKYGNGITHEGSFFLTLKPGKLAALWRSGSSTPVSELITPGTETEDLLGTVTLTAWLVGYDFETEEEICKSNEITRTWKVGKNAEPEDLGDSNLSGKLEVRPGYEPSDPAGYQLGEPVSTVLTVENVGPIDLETFTVSDPWDDTTFSDGPISVSGTRSYIRADITVTEDDVEKGYIEFPMITIKWTDPDTKKERTTFAGPLTVPVLKKTGLLLKKGYEDPKNGEYFAEGEQIAWTLSVTNNSKESITDVKVDDQGVTVGEYAELKPNDKENCTVPKHTVTEYEAKVVGYVLNSATATGTDYRGATKTWPSNVAKAITKKPTEPGEDPKGDPHGLLPAISIVKAEDPAGPANGSYYEANEAIKYTITVKNTGDTELKDIAVTDSLAGFTPIGTLASLAPSEEKTFDYAYTVKEEDIPYQWIYNSATVTYTFGENVKGTPRTSNTVQSRVGDEPFPPELPHLDPDKLPEGDDWCRLTLESLGENEARYTLHACAEHAEAAMAAEEAAANGDWKAAAAIWEAEVEELYELLYNAADSQLKGALIEERAVFYDYLDSFDPLTVDETVRSMRANVDSLYDLLLATADEAKTAELLAEKEKLYADIDASYGGSEGEARANALRLKCAFLCCAMHTVPNELPSSLAGDYAQMMGGMETDKTARLFGALDGTDTELTETYAGAALKAQNDVIDLLSNAKSYNANDVFARGQQLWQAALDNEVNPVYEAADKEQRTLIATWRISLDTLYESEQNFLSLLYEGNDETQEELLMELYKDAVILAGIIK